MDHPSTATALEQPKFFGWHDDHLRTRGAPWASHFLVMSNHRTCSACGRKVPYQSGPATAEVDAGAVWTDVVGGGGSYPSFMVSERIVDVLNAEGITSFTAYPVELTVTAKKLRGVPAPRYFWIKCARSVRCDEQKSGASFPPISCATCGGRATNTNQRWVVPRWAVIEPDSWLGDDLFDFANAGPGGGMFCTRRVIELAHRHRWTCCWFIPLDIKRGDVGSWRGINYLAKRWPPKWYPEPDDMPVAGGGEDLPDGSIDCYPFRLERLMQDGSTETLWESPRRVWKKK